MSPDVSRTGGQNESRPDLSYRAPLQSVDLSIRGPIYPCLDCLPWFLEVLDDGGCIFAREWHAEECPTLVGLLTIVDEPAAVPRPKPEAK